MAMETYRKLYRSETDRILAGVCGGLGDYFEIDPLLFRIVFLILAFAGGSGILIYLILILIMPRAGDKRGAGFTDVGEKAQEIAAEIKSHRAWSPERRRNTLGIILIILGLLFFLNQVFPYFVRWDVFWPLVVIAAGIFILARRHG